MTQPGEPPIHVPFLERAFRVRSYECDGYGHVNHANYLRYMQEAAFDASAAAGYDLEIIRAGRLQRKGFPLAH